MVRAFAATLWGVSAVLVFCRMQVLDAKNGAIKDLQYEVPDTLLRALGPLLSRVWIDLCELLSLLESSLLRLRPDLILWLGSPQTCSVNRR